MDAKLIAQHSQQLSVATTHPIFILDEHNEIVDANEAFYTETGYLAENFKYKMLANITVGAAKKISAATWHVMHATHLMLIDADQNQLPYSANIIQLPNKLTAFICTSAKAAALLEKTSGATAEQSMRTLLEYQTNLQQVSLLMAKHLTSEEMLNEILTLGCQLLKMETGIISQVSNDNYKIIALNTPLDVFSINEKLALKNTYCSTVIKEQDCVYFEHIAMIKTMRVHPLYKSLKLESYLGLPLIINKQCYGTLSFYSQHARNNPFAWHEIQTIKLLTHLVENNIEVALAKEKETTLKAKLKRMTRSLA
jgi:transcriptional regulator with GAF, ATPase, and Fis domain